MCLLSFIEWIVSLIFRACIDVTSTINHLFVIPILLYYGIIDTSFNQPKHISTRRSRNGRWHLLPRENSFGRCAYIVLFVILSTLEYATSSLRFLQVSLQKGQSPVLQLVGFITTRNRSTSDVYSIFIFSTIDELYNLQTKGILFLVCCPIKIGNLKFEFCLRKTRLFFTLVCKFHAWSTLANLHSNQFICEYKNKLYFFIKHFQLPFWL